MLNILNINSFPLVPINNNIIMGHCITTFFYYSFLLKAPMTFVLLDQMRLYMNK